MNRRLSRQLDSLAVFLAWAAVSWPWLIGSRFTTGDNVGFYFPITKFVVTSVLRGDPPWWNPLAYGGQPLLGDPQSMLFSPHAVVGLLLGRAFNLHVFDVTTLCCLLIGGLSTLAFGRQYTDEPGLPVIGAIVFMMGGVASSRLQHVSEIVSYSLIPLQLVAMRQMCRRPDWKTVLAFVLAIEPSMLSPNQVVFLSSLVLMPFFVMFILRSEQPVKALTSAGCAALAALAIAAPVLSCIREVLSISNRPHLPITDSNVFSFPLLNFAGFILPGLYGIMKVSRGVWPPTDCSEDYIYIGIVPFLILFWILLCPSRMSRPSLLAATLTIMWCVFSSGVNGFLYPLLFHFIPGVSAFRRPADAAFLFNLCISLMIATATIKGERRCPAYVHNAISAFTLIVLALVGWQVITGLAAFAELRGHASDLVLSYRKLGLRTLIVLVAILCVSALPKTRRPQAFSAVAIILCVLDLAFSGRFSPLFVLPYSQSAAAELYLHPAKTALLGQGPAKVLRFLNEKEGSERRQVRVETLGGVLAANLPMTDGLSMTQGYNPLTLASYSRLVGAQSLQVEQKVFTSAAPNYGSEIYRRLSLRYVLIPTYTLSRPDSANIAIRAELNAGAVATLQATIDEYEIWELAGSRPKVDFLSRQMSAGDECHIRKYRNDFLEIECTAKQPVELVVGDNDAPGWSACVDQKSVSISTYLGLFRQVPVEIGHSIMTMRYQPVPFFRFNRCK